MNVTPVLFKVPVILRNALADLIKEGLIMPVHGIRGNGFFRILSLKTLDIFPTQLKLY